MLKHSEWRVGPVETGGITCYQVYRLIDAEGENWRGNRETRGGYYDNILYAERLAKNLNEEEAKK